MYFKAPLLKHAPSAKNSPRRVCPGVTNRESEPPRMSLDAVYGGTLLGQMGHSYDGRLLLAFEERHDSYEATPESQGSAA